MVGKDFVVPINLISGSWASTLYKESNLNKTKKILTKVHVREFELTMKFNKLLPVKMTNTWSPA
jgi:hypothetical protein